MEGHDESSLDLPAVLDEPHTSCSERGLVQARRVYGPQLTTPFHSIRYLLRGCLSTADVTRWYQANQMVCSGTTPAGTPADFGERHGNWSKKARDMEAEYVEQSIEDILIYTPLVSVISIIHKEACLSLDVAPHVCFASLR